jgi:CBS domain-containing protein
MGLPREGRAAAEPWIGDVADRDPPTCRLDDTVEEARRRVDASPHDVCIVVNDAGIVLGLLTAKSLEGDPSAKAERAMRPGPSTFRPNVSVHEMLHYMAEHDLPRAIVTDSTGKLLGILDRDEAARGLTRG